VKVFLCKGEKSSIQGINGTIEGEKGGGNHREEERSLTGEWSVFPGKGGTKGGKLTLRLGKAAVWEGCAKGYRREA